MITIRKLSHDGKEKTSYPAEIVSRTETSITVQAIFARDDVDQGFVVFRKGDRMVEWFYADRWYNIFAVHDVTDDHLKGWYCDITFPASISDTEVSWRDLALDVWVTPTGDLQVVDEDEFDALQIDAETRSAGWQAVADIYEHVERREPPFDVLPAKDYPPKQRLVW
jgi:predicted RNA-binding protein associated with RNAse of E/G family